VELSERESPKFKSLERLFCPIGETFLIPDFQEFCRGWNDKYVKLKNEGASTKQIGHAFETYFLENVLLPYIPKGYKTALDQKRDGVKIRGNDYKFDLLVVKGNAVDYRGIAPSDVLAAFEVKSHGFFDDGRAKERVKTALEVDKKFPNVRLFYVAYRETGSHDAKARTIFGNVVRRYYRLADSGDGVQIPPREYFQKEWDRLLIDLSELSSACV